MSSVVNIAAYKFVKLHNLAELRQQLRSFCTAQELRGSILLSPEGINLFVAGSRSAIDSLLAIIRAIPGLADLEVKESLSREQPFNRMLVKIKREIIAFGVEGIDPRQYRSRRLKAAELKQWLDEGRPVTLLDTRNNYEVQIGTFEKAVAADIDDFRDFPKAVARLPEEWKEQPVVTFCTGGIRCEKAAPYLESRGFRDVYQLDGGILRYFEEIGPVHYRGHCFVFDKRVAIDPALQESAVKQCFACQAVLSPEDLASTHYLEGKSCPHCHRPEVKKRAELIADRHRELRRATSPLPGSIPYDNVRPISVPLRLDHFEVLEFLEAMKTHLSGEEWRRACEEGRLLCRGEPVLPGRHLRAGDRLLHTMPATCEPDVAAEIKIVDEDEAIVVVNKPAPLPIHPCGRFNRNSLSYILNLVYKPLKLRPVHRLDADTTGIVIFAKTSEIARLLHPQFEAGEVKKSYIARVQGRPAQSVFECNWPIRADAGTNGVRLPDEDGSPAHTHFRLLQEFEEGTSLLEAEPLTGRTNQIRAHLWKLNLPIVGDPIYLPDGKLGAAKSLSVGEPPMYLHAASIEFLHPLSKERVVYKAAIPTNFLCHR